MIIYAFLVSDVRRNPALWAKDFVRAKRCLRGKVKCCQNAVSAEGMFLVLAFSERDTKGNLALAKRARTGGSGVLAG